MKNVTSTAKSHGATLKDALYRHIEALITRAPRRFAELKRLTRAEDNAIKSVLIRLQRDNPNCVNLGNRYKAFWAIVSDDFLERMRNK